jgi:DNA-binding LytR/AlgR family response regulator
MILKKFDWSILLNEENRLYRHLFFWLMVTLWPIVFKAHPKNLTSAEIDLLFLDINMPRLSGMSMLRSLNNAPDVINALEGFELSVTDYLLKPFSFERFVQATEKVIEKRLECTSNSNIKEESETYIFVKSDKKQIKIDINEIRFIESYGNYIHIYTSNEKVTTKQTLTDFEKQLPLKAFIRIHKSYIVAYRHIKYMEGNQVSVGESKLPVGKVFRYNLLKIFGNK